MHDVIDLAFRLYELILVVRVILSWVQIQSRHPLVTFVYSVTEPLLAPIRKLLPTDKIGIDLSPLILLFLLEMLKKYLLF
ncbi:MAG: YggT family protein [Fibrobacter sp.]|nr:YggT family protein [Fibrobacter sp.]